MLVWTLEESLAREKNENIVIVKEKEALSCRLDDLGLKLETTNKEMEEKNESIGSLQVKRERNWGKGDGVKQTERDGEEGTERGKEREREREN